METVLRLAVPSNFSMPWERLIRGCLVIVMFAMLYLDVQNYTKDFTAKPGGSIVRFEEKESIPAIIPADIIGNVKSTTESTEQGMISLSNISNDKLGKRITAPPANTVINRNRTSSINIVAPATDMNYVADDVPAINTGHVKNNTPIIDMDHVENNIPSIDTGNMENSIPSIDVDNTENTIPAIDTDNIENTIPVINVDNMESQVPADRTDDIEINDPVADGTTIDSTITDEDSSNAENNGIREVNGFLIDSEGYITGITDNTDITDGILVLAWEAECIGVKSDALTKFAEYVEEIYIPANICDIEPGTFDMFSSTTYFEVAPDNPCYYSENGFLYSR